MNSTKSQAQHIKTNCINEHTETKIKNTVSFKYKSNKTCTGLTCKKLQNTD